MGDKDYFADLVTGGGVEVEPDAYEIEHIERMEAVDAAEGVSTGAVEADEAIEKPEAPSTEGDEPATDDPAPTDPPTEADPTDETDDDGAGDDAAQAEKDAQELDAYKKFVAKYDGDEAKMAKALKELNQLASSKREVPEEVLTQTRESVREELIEDLQPKLEAFIQQAQQEAWETAMAQVQQQTSSAEAIDVAITLAGSDDVNDHKAALEVLRDFAPGDTDALNQVANILRQSNPPLAAAVDQWRVDNAIEEKTSELEGRFAELSAPQREAAHLTEMKTATAQGWQELTTGDEVLASHMAATTLPDGTVNPVVKGFAEYMKQREDWFENLGSESETPAQEAKRLFEHAWHEYAYKNGVQRYQSPVNPSDVVARQQNAATTESGRAHAAQQAPTTEDAYRNKIYSAFRGEHLDR